MADALNREIARLTSTLRLHSAVIGTGWGIAAALLLELLAALIARITPWLYQTELLLALVWAVGGGALLGAVSGYVWPHPLPQRLRLFDRRLQLADRLTTAWELAQGRIHAPNMITRLQREETLRAVRVVDPHHAFPARLSRNAGILALITILGLVPALLVANPQEAKLARQAMQQQATEAAITQLETTQDALAENTTLSAAEREAALKALEEALSVLQDRRSTPDEQQAALTEAERQLADLRSPETEAQIQRLAEAAPLTTEAIVQPFTEALQQGDTEAAAAYLRDLIDPTNERPLTPEEILALADAFEQLADALQETDPALAAQFQEIAQETYSGDMTEAQQAVAEAAETLSETAQANAPNQTLEQAQASLQQAQESLGDSQRQTTTQVASGGTATQPGGTGSQQGPGSEPSQAAGNGSGSGTGSSGHHEDAGSSAPYGTEDAPRIADEGGEITLPREKTLGAPQTTTGVPGEARIPYQDVYATYAEAAEADLARNVYPPALRTYVREYFSGLGQ